MDAECILFEKFLAARFKTVDGFRLPTKNRRQTVPIRPPRYNENFRLRWFGDLALCCGLFFCYRFSLSTIDGVILYISL